MKKLLILNWKHHWVEQWQSYHSLALMNHPSVEVMIAPPTPMIGLMAQTIGHRLVAQSVGDQPLGAYTGAFGPAYLKHLDVHYALLGHSESRLQGQDNAHIQASFAACLEQGVRPVLCCGEMLGEDIEEVIGEQLGFLEEMNVKEAWVAYEPRWAIGSQTSCSIERLHQTHQIIDDYLSERNIETHLLYGGGVNQQTIHEFLSLPFVEGLLLGKLALDLGALQQIVEYPCPRAA